jgi:hypothetical protein
VNGTRGLFASLSSFPSGNFFLRAFFGFKGAGGFNLVFRVRSLKILCTDIFEHFLQDFKNLHTLFLTFNFCFTKTKFEKVSNKNYKCSSLVLTFLILF